MEKPNISEVLEQRMKDGREYRSLEMRAVGEPDEMIVEGYATTFDEPYLLYSEPGYKFYEIVDRHALDQADQSDVVMRYDHEGRVFARNSNSTLMLTTDDHGYKVRGLLGGTDLGRQIYQEISGGYTTRMSWAFRVSEDSREVVENKETGEMIITRRILSVSKVYDVAPVAIPANDATEISARSYCDGVIAELEAERLRAEAEAEERRRKVIAIKILAEAK